MDPTDAVSKSLGFFQYITSEGGILSAVLICVIIGEGWLYYKIYSKACETRSAEIMALLARNKEISDNTVKAFDKNETLLKETIQSRERTAVSLGEIANAIASIPTQIENLILRAQAKNHRDD